MADYFVNLMRKNRGRSEARRGLPLCPPLFNYMYWDHIFLLVGAIISTKPL